MAEKGKMMAGEAEGLPRCTIKYKENPNKPMKVVEWHGKKNIKVNPKRPSPEITDPVSQKNKEERGDGRESWMGKGGWSGEIEKEGGGGGREGKSREELRGK
jgi:hypothetical protein